MCDIPEAKWGDDLTGHACVFDLLSDCMTDLMRKPSAEMDRLVENQLMIGRSLHGLFELAETISDTDPVPSQFTTTTLKGTESLDERDVLSSNNELDAVQIANIELQNEQQ